VMRHSSRTPIHGLKAKRFFSASKAGKLPSMVGGVGARASKNNERALSVTQRMAANLF
jgi:hypothetical protein